jgi:LacI family transcriptional regulator
VATRKPSIHDIARAAGVGVGTVSRVLNEHPSVAEATRVKVAAVMEELGYRPTFAARHIRTGRSQLFGFLTDKVTTTPFAHDLIKGAQERARQADRMLMVIDADGDDRTREQAVANLIERGVEGIVYAAMFHHKVHVPEALHEVPTVLVDSFAVGRDFPSVVPDEVTGGRQATERLLVAGHRRIGMVTNDALATGYPAAVGRLAGYREALDRAGVPFDEALVREGSGNADSGYHWAHELLDVDDPPTAFFFGTDRMAMGAYFAFTERGLTVPDDVSVVGFDDQHYIADALRPSLTTMALPHAAMGRWAIEHLLTAPWGEDRPPLQWRLPCPIVERGSVGPVPESGVGEEP